MGMRWTHQEKEKMGGIERLALKHLHYHVQKRQLVGSCCVTHSLGLCGDLEGWDGGREAQDGGEYMHTYCMLL